MSVGKKIKKLREDAKITQETLANIVYVSRSTVAKWEADITAPKSEYLNKLADYFKVNIEYFSDDINVKALIEMFWIPFLLIYNLGKCHYSDVGALRHQESVFNTKKTFVCLCIIEICSEFFIYHGALQGFDIKNDLLMFNITIAFGINLIRLIMIIFLLKFIIQKLMKYISGNKKDIRV